MACSQNQSHIDRSTRCPVSCFSSITSLCNPKFTKKIEKNQSLQLRPIKELTINHQKKTHRHHKKDFEIQKLLWGLYDLQVLVFVANKSKEAWNLKLLKSKKEKNGSYPESDRRNMHCNISLFTRRITS